MRGTSATRSRGEMSEQVEKNNQDMQEKNEELDVIADDNEIIYETLESLDFGGTSEGAEQVEQAIHSAGDMTTADFDGREGELEGLKQETENTQSDFQEIESISESDQEKINGAVDKIQTTSPVNDLTAAERSIQEDIDFLNEQGDLLNKSLEEAESLRQQNRSRLKQ